MGRISLVFRVRPHILILICGLLACLLISNNKAWAQKPGSAIDINGGSEHVSVTDHSSLDLPNTFTISFWLNVDDNSTNRTILQKGDFSNNDINYAIELYSRGGSPQLQFFAKGSSNSYLSTYSSIPPVGEWVHIAATFNQGNLKLFFNGLQETSQTFTTSSLPTNSYDLNIGKGANSNIDGQIDEVRIWNTVRTESEIQKYMHQVAPTGNSNLVAYYQFENNANDQSTSTNANDGTLQNSPSYLTSNAVITDDTDLENGGTHDQDIKAIWQANTTTNEDGGLKLSGSASGFSSGDYIVFAHNSNTGKTKLTSNNTIEKKLNRDWQFDEEGSPPNVDLTFITSKAGESGFSSVSDVTDYLFLKASSSANGGYTDLSTGDSYSTASNSVTFNGNSVTNETYSLGTANSSNAPLPVELLYFKVKQKGKNALLEWETASETQNSHFIIQKRTGKDGTWQDIGQVQGHGTSSTGHSYQFEDNKVNNPIQYYRLKQVDWDGSYEHHPVKALKVQQNTDFDFQVIQNPARSNINLSVSSPENSSYQFTLTTLNGRAVKQTTRNLSKGEQNLQIAVEGLKAGMYLLKINGANQVLQKRVLKN